MSNQRTQKPFEKDFRQKRVSAFLTTSLALFCLCCLLSSASIKQFSTFTNLKISSENEDTQSLVRSVIEQQTADEQLSKFVTEAAKSADMVANTDIATHNLSQIRDCLNIQLLTQPDSPQHTLCIRFKGKGTECEKHLTESLAKQVARQLDSRLLEATSRTRLKELVGQVERRVDDLSNNLYSDLEQAGSQVTLINAELSNVHRAIEELGPQLGGSDRFSMDGQQIIASINTLDQIGAAIRQFGQPGIEVDMEGVSSAISNIRLQLVDLRNEVSSSAERAAGPMRVVNTSLDSRSTDAQPILNSLEKIDTDSLHGDLEKLQDAVRNEAIQLRHDLGELKIASKTMSAGNVTVDSISKLKTTPVQSAPGLPHVILFGLLAAFIGTCVSMVYQPALDCVGFASIDETAGELGIPVVATLNQDSPNTTPPTFVVANTIVRVSEVVLFAFLLLIILLCLTQADIRETMLANPIHGLSKISGLFFG